MFSGKGGVGKTTLSCGFARAWAQQFPNERVLLLSTDPAHSLGDVLQMTVEDSPHPMPNLPNLQVRALDAQRLLADFKNRYGKVLELLVERGSFVQGEDLSPVWDLSWPGLDELMGILEIQRILRDQEADRVVVDMAPSGHTLNLFGLMDFLDEFLKALDLFQEKHRVISESFGGRHQRDEADDFLIEMQEDLRTGRELLQNSDRTACLIVAIPEPMSWCETHRFLDALLTLNIPVGGIFLNHWLPADSAVDRRVEQQHLLEKFRAIAPSPLFCIPQQNNEPVGAEGLDRLMAQLVTAPDSVGEVTPEQRSFQLPPIYAPGFEDFVTAGRRLVIVGGKGGVGKTTVSAAIAWGLAARHPDQSVRIISIDPAHSLGDAYGTLLQHEATAITANLSGQEVDAEKILQQFREDYLWELAEMMSGETGSDDLRVAYGPEAWKKIVSQALPGIDEMLALITVMELLESGEQQLIVLDTAPTGHLLRFLEMPTALGDWLAWIFKLWLKYQDVAGRVELMGRLRTLRKRVMDAQKKLKDPAYTEFIGVVQAQSPILAEAERLTQSLKEMAIAQRYIVHNRYEVGYEIPAEQFCQQSIVRLAQLPRLIPAGNGYADAPLGQVQIAASLLFNLSSG
ncbi:MULTISPECIES: ArsA family ATPase [unclassified Leptolyngbya]|uniref:TRC40/GET3/ArsA family transport-energizing ATPase n=1 Tax=unclassified Leptolyngbya TaxID=2650499 RepID=UPI001689F0BA|nr:ArsA family ATPase [Leptolyngbya sp. FACHB-8]MBD2154765.1 ArsA family ATPase [Leptolyngbya sp. FACHB-16]